MLGEASLAQLLEWSRLPGLLPRVRSGPDRGKDWREIDEDVVEGFTYDRDPDVRYTAEQELARRHGGGAVGRQTVQRSEEHTSELQSLMRISYAVFCLKKKKHTKPNTESDDKTKR